MGTICSEVEVTEDVTRFGKLACTDSLADLNLMSSFTKEYRGNGRPWSAPVLVLQISFTNHEIESKSKAQLVEPRYPVQNN